MSDYAPKGIFTGQNDNRDPEYSGPQYIQGERYNTGIYSPEIEKAKRFSDQLADHSQQTAYLAKLENAQTFSEVFPQFTFSQAFTYHDDLIRGINPNAKSSPESFAQTMKEIMYESWDEQMYSYVAGLIGNGDDSPELRRELDRLKNKTKNGTRMEDLLQDMSITGKAGIKKWLAETANQLPQQLGRAKEKLGFNYNRAAYGYEFGSAQGYEEGYERSSPLKQKMEFLMNPLAKAGEFLTADARYTHVTHSGQMYLDFWNTIEEEGIDISDEQMAEVNAAIRSYSNQYTALTTSTHAADLVAAGFGVVGGAKILQSTIGQGAVWLAKTLAVQGASAGESAIMEYFQSLTSMTGQHLVNQVIGLEAEGEISEDQMDRYKEAAWDAAGMSGRVSLVMGGASLGGGLAIGGGQRIAGAFSAEPNRQLSKDTQNAMAARPEVEARTNRAMSAAILGDVAAETQTEPGTFADMGALRQEKLRHDLTQMVTRMEEAPIGQMDESTYNAYRATLAQTIESNNIQRPDGLHTTNAHAIQWENNTEYPGKFTIDFAARDLEDVIIVNFESDKTNNLVDVEFQVFQGDSAGIEVQPSVGLEFPADHPISQRMNEVVQDYVNSYMREGAIVNVEDLNLPQNIKDTISNLDADILNMKQIPLSELEGEQQSRTIGQQQIDLMQSLIEQDPDSFEAGAIKQALYLYNSDQTMLNAIQYGGEVGVSNIQRIMEARNLPDYARRGMENTLIKAGIYPKTPELKAQYENLPSDRNQWSVDEQRIARKFEAPDTSSLTFSELSRIHDKIKAQSLQADHILDMQKAGRLVNAEEGVNIALEEVRQYHNLGDMSQTELFEKNVKAKLQEKVNNGLALAESADVIAQSIAGQDSLTYDTAMIQPRESIREATRNAKRIQNQFTENMKRYNEANGLPTKGFKFEYEQQKWRITKTEFDGVKLTNGEMLSLLMHSRSEDNMTHLQSGIQKDINGRLVNINPEIVKKATAHAKTDPRLTYMADTMKPLLLEIRLLEQDLLRILMADPDLKFGLNNYFPISIAEGFYDNFDGDFTVSDGQGNRRLSTYKKMLYERTSRPDAPIVLEDGMGVFQTSVERGSKFGYAEQSFWKASRLIFDPSFKQHVVAAKGIKTYDALVKGLTDMASQNDMWGTGHEIFQKPIKGLLKMRSIKALGANPVSALRAWASIAGAASYTDVDVAVKAATMVGKSDETGGKTVSQFAREMSLIYQNRVDNGTYPEFMRGKDTTNISPKGQAYQKAAYFMMKQIDSETAARAWMAGYMQVQKDLKTGTISDITARTTGITQKVMSQLGETQKIQLAIQVGDEVMNRSQPSSEMQTRSTVQRAGTLGAIFTQFGSSINAQRQQLFEIGHVLKRTDLNSQQKAQTITKIGTSVALQSAIYTGIGLMASGLKGQFTDEEYPVLQKAQVDYANTLFSLGYIGSTMRLKLGEATLRQQRRGAGDFAVSAVIDPFAALQVEELADMYQLFRSYLRAVEDGDDTKMTQNMLDILILVGSTIPAFTPFGAGPESIMNQMHDAGQNWLGEE